jgi:catechol 2,3-dioxygenase-like lactoylglutathione lyase family enzyme
MSSRLRGGQEVENRAVGRGPTAVDDRERCGEMTVTLRGLDAITLFVEDLERTRSFYGDVFGLELLNDDEDSAAFHFDNTIVNLLRIPAARELIEPGAVGGPQAGSRFQLTTGVADSDAACAELDTRGVALNGPMDRAWGVRTASFSDPAGHIREIAQNLSRAEDVDSG